MKEFKEQILLNQISIMEELIRINERDYKDSIPSCGHLYLRINSTKDLLNPTKQPSITERTHDALSKDGEE